MRSHYRYLLIAFCFLVIVFNSFTTASADTDSKSVKSSVRINAIDFMRYHLTDPAHLQLIHSTANLGGKSPENNFYGVTGWFEYDFVIKQAGWYELLVETAKPFRQNQYGFQHDYLIDGSLYLNGSGYFSASDQNNFKVANLWLAAGSHTLRVQKYHWTGFHPITGFRINASDKKLSNRLRLSFADNQFFGDASVMRGQSIPLALYSDGKFQPRQLALGVYDTSARRVKLLPVAPASFSKSGNINVELDTTELNAGAYSIRTIWNQTIVDERDVRRLDFVVVDPTSFPESAETVDKNLVKNGLIDCADPSQPPDYVDHSTMRGAHTSSIRYINGPAGKTIQSGNNGFRENHKTREKINWFGYQLPPVSSDAAYALEVDYPDDRWRSFVFGIREKTPMDLTLATGIDSGGEYTLSRTKQTATLFFWPRNNESPRLFFLNANNGSTAPCMAARLYRLSSALPPLKISTQGGRHFSYWFEEHDRWATVFGARNKSLDEYRKSAERWAQTARYMGVDSLQVTATIYNSSLYPSRDYNKMVTSAYHPDLLKLLLLVTEKYGIKLIVGLHPQALELRQANSDNKLYDLEGNTRAIVPTGPVRGTGGVQPDYDPLNQENQRWLTDMIGEIAERYRQSTSLAGIELRIMAWANPSFNNLVNLDWGYGDDTMEQFASDTNLDLTNKSFKERHNTLTSPAYREKWIDWRCEKIAGLYAGLVSTVRQVRNDLLFFSVFNGGFGFPADPRESGLCPQQLSKINGLVFIDADHGYGRISITPDYWKSRIADLELHARMFDVERLQKFTNVGMDSYSPALMMSGWYIEDGGSSVRPEDLGMQKNTAHPWISAQMHGAGRNDLERYAFAVAATDARLLVNGGNGYYLDFPPVREFMAEFRSLPAKGFTTIKGMSDPVVVRYLLQENDTLFYLVNREPYSINVEVEFPSAVSVNRLSNDISVANNTRKITVALNAFELLGYRIDKAIVLSKVNLQIPKEQLIALSEKINWLEKLSRELSANNTALKISENDKAFLFEIVQKLRKAHSLRNTWEARQLLKNPQLYRLYRQTGKFPPFVDQPQV